MARDRSICGWTRREPRRALRPTTETRRAGHARPHAGIPRTREAPKNRRSWPWLVHSGASTLRRVRRSATDRARPACSASGINRVRTATALFANRGPQFDGAFYRGAVALPRLPAGRAFARASGRVASPGAMEQVRAPRIDARTNPRIGAHAHRQDGLPGPLALLVCRGAERAGVRFAPYAGGAGTRDLRHSGDSARPATPSAGRDRRCGRAVRRSAIRDMVRIAQGVDDAR